MSNVRALKLHRDINPAASFRSLLSGYGDVDGRVFDAVTDLLGPARSWAQEAPRDDAAPLLISSGWAASAALLADGRRQIFELLGPGDIVGLWPEETPEHTLLPITSLQVVDASSAVEALRCPPGEQEGPSAAWTAYERAARVRTLRHVLRLGRLTAIERAADLFVELHERQVAAGLISGATIEFPFTQDILADLLGLSAVHVNRTLQQLRRDRLLEYGGRRATINDIDALRSLAMREA
jgi:hypothetical protein